MLRPSSCIEQRGMADHGRGAAHPPRQRLSGFACRNGLGQARGQRVRPPPNCHLKRSPKSRGFCPSGLKNVAPSKCADGGPRIIRIRRFSASSHHRSVDPAGRTACGANSPLSQHSLMPGRVQCRARRVVYCPCARSSGNIGATGLRDCEHGDEANQRAVDAGRGFRPFAAARHRPQPAGDRDRAGRGFPAAGARRQDHPCRRGFCRHRAARLAC